jgi:hypothetical protein
MGYTRTIYNASAAATATVSATVMADVTVTAVVHYYWYCCYRHQYRTFLLALIWMMCLLDTCGYPSVLTSLMRTLGYVTRQGQAFLTAKTHHLVRLPVHNIWHASGSSAAVTCVTCITAVKVTVAKYC